MVFVLEPCPILKTIIGKGLHSHGGVAKVKPAIEELIQKWANEFHPNSEHCYIRTLRYKLVAQLDPNNSGVLIVYLDSSSSQGIGAEEISRRLAHENDSCVIMWEVINNSVRKNK